MQPKCPQCGKTHRARRALEKCDAESQSMLGHFIIQGLPEQDPRMIAARAEANAFRAYRTTLPN